MNASRQVTWLAGTLLVVCMAGAIFLLQALDQIRPTATLDESLYITSPKVLKFLSLGYDGLLADIYWTRAVQYFGEHHHRGKVSYKLLAPLLQITTALDPHLVVAYQFGANFLAPDPPNGAGMPHAAIELAEFGIHNNPDEWRLYYELGFIYYMELHDYGKAAEAFARGSHAPKAHPFLRIMAGLMAEHAGDLQTSRMMWTTTYESTQEEAIRNNAAAHLRALQVDEDITKLQELVDHYRERTGRLPQSFADLSAAGMLRGTPRDPLDHPYLLTRDGNVEIQSPDDLPFVTKGLPPGYKPPAIPKIPSPN
jgi:tetratricopeptide (TPR) repeat protein